MSTKFTEENKVMEKSVDDHSNQKVIEETMDPEDHSVPIILSKGNHMFDLDQEALEDLLLSEDIKDRTVIVISVAGAFRKGKSFILDFFLRYMYHTYKNDDVINTEGDWLGPLDKPLEGFSWRGGSERETTGILMWSKIFRTTLPNGEKVAIILLDTQGTFDSESTVRECATVFALSTMISSIQIYNVSQNIQEDDLQHLQLFTEYGRLALADSGKKPFQKLLFLVRDWSFPYEAQYGNEGGERILNKRLNISSNQHPELQSIRKHVRSCFSSINCFLMPHPGLKVATNPSFDGRIADIESEFQSSLKELVVSLLSPENLILKEISGQKVKAKELLQYFKSYITIYGGDELPEPKSMLVATAEANNLAAVASAKEAYHLRMEDVCGGTKPYLNTSHLEAEHLRIKSMSIEQFRSKRKMGGEEFSETYRIKLETDMDELFELFRQHNESKNIFKAARTPAVFFAVAFVFYVLSGILGLLGIYPLANLCNLVMGVALLSLMTWAFIRYRGEMLEVGEALDATADVIWDDAMKPCYQVFVEKSIQHAVTNSTVPSLNRSISLNGKPKRT